MEEGLGGAEHRSKRQRTDALRTSCELLCACAMTASEKAYTTSPSSTIAIVDEDHSELSRRIARAFLPSYFQPPQSIAERDIVPLMNAGRYTFVLDIPPDFERHVLGGRQPEIQLDVDATAMVQAGLGAD
jgi:hypothetical protein